MAKKDLVADAPEASGETDIHSGLPADFSVKDEDLGDGTFSVSIARRRELTNLAFSLAESIESLPPHERHFTSTALGNILAGSEMDND